MIEHGWHALGEELADAVQEALAEAGTYRRQEDRIISAIRGEQPAPIPFDHELYLDEIHRAGEEQYRYNALGSYHTGQDTQYVSVQLKQFPQRQCRSVVWAVDYHDGKYSLGLEGPSFALPGQDISHQSQERRELPLLITDAQHSYDPFTLSVDPDTQALVGSLSIGAELDGYKSLFCNFVYSAERQDKTFSQILKRVKMSGQRFQHHTPTYLPAFHLLQRRHDQLSNLSSERKTLELGYWLGAYVRNKPDGRNDIRDIPLDALFRSTGAIQSTLAHSSLDKQWYTHLLPRRKEAQEYWMEANEKAITKAKEMEVWLEDAPDYELAEEILEAGKLVGIL